MAERASLFDHVRRLIAESWPERHSYFGVRLTLRSLIRSAKQLRDQERREDSEFYAGAARIAQARDE